MMSEYLYEIPISENTCTPISAFACTPISGLTCSPISDFAFVPISEFSFMLYTVSHLVQPTSLPSIIPSTHAQGRYFLLSCVR